MKLQKLFVMVCGLMSMMAAQAQPHLNPFSLGRVC